MLRLDPDSERRLTMTEQREHIPEIDWIKGFAILLVICIHAELYEGTWFYKLLINRAVMIFLVMFGVNSELWWQREERRGREHVTRRWFVSRLRRIVPGYWAMMAAWWLAVVFWRRPADNLILGPLQAVVTFFGYAPWVGTSWFVTVILVYILVFPALRRALSVLPVVVSLAIGAFSAWASGKFMFDIIDVGKALLGNNIQWPGWYYHWIFAPRALWHVVAGVFIVRWWGGHIGPRVTIAAVVLTAIGVAATIIARGDPEDVYGPMRELSVAGLVDVPLTIALLGIFRVARFPKPVQSFLGWCGVWSWGIYLAHLLIHELIRIGGFKAGLAPQHYRAAYAVLLFVSGSALAVFTEWLKNQFSRFTSRADTSNAA